jgi:hypothetical protein
VPTTHEAAGADGEEDTPASDGGVAPSKRNRGSPGSSSPSIPEAEAYDGSPKRAGAKPVINWEFPPRVVGGSNSLERR